MRGFSAASLSEVWSGALSVAPRLLAGGAGLVAAAAVLPPDGVQLLLRHAHEREQGLRRGGAQRRCRGGGLIIPPTAFLSTAHPDEVIKSGPVLPSLVMGGLLRDGLHRYIPFGSPRVLFPDRCGRSTLPGMNKPIATLGAIRSRLVRQIQLGYHPWNIGATVVGNVCLSESATT
eukprot:1188587-Prorocentrum_minimum.AAC.1